MTYDPELCPHLPHTFTRGSSAALEAAGLAKDIGVKTESPIETLLGVAMIRHLEQKYAGHPSTTFHVCSPGDEDGHQGFRVLLMAQYPWRRYRVDWALKLCSLEQPYVFVECDGKDFHSSEDQIVRDRARDAEMNNAGIPVLRFTGADIHRAAGTCALLVYNAMHELYRAQIKSAA